VQLENKVAVVTGASSGIGEAIALAFGEQGATVSVDYRSHADERDRVEVTDEAVFGYWQVAARVGRFWCPCAPGVKAGVSHRRLLCSQLTQDFSLRCVLLVLKPKRNSGSGGDEAVRSKALSARVLCARDVGEGSRQPTGVICQLRLGRSETLIGAGPGQSGFPRRILVGNWVSRSKKAV
jgi:short subunit dehydrogenase